MIITAQDCKQIAKISMLGDVSKDIELLGSIYEQLESTLVAGGKRLVLYRSELSPRVKRILRKNGFKLSPRNLFDWMFSSDNLWDLTWD